MMIDAAFLLLLITGFVSLLYILAFWICCRRLQVTGAAQRSLFMAALSFYALWIAIVASLGNSHILADFSRLPPPFMIFFLAILGSAFIFSYSNLGLVLAKGLSYAELIGFHVLRIFIEISLLVGAQEGLTPRAMTLHGWNFDLVTGVSALVLCFYLPRFPNLRYVRIWNWMGLGFLTIVVFIAIFSFPTPWRVFTEEPSNLWVTIWPYIVLPGCLVWSALIGHLLIFKKLKLDPKSYS
jgi:hypothetical protein